MSSREASPVPEQEHSLYEQLAAFVMKWQDRISVDQEKVQGMTAGHPENMMNPAVARESGAVAREQMVITELNEVLAPYAKKLPLETPEVTPSQE